MMGFIRRLISRPTAPQRVWPPGPAHWVASYRSNLEQFAETLDRRKEAPGATLHFDQHNKHVRILDREGALLAEVIIEREDGRDIATATTYKLSELACDDLSEILQIPVSFLLPS